MSPYHDTCGVVLLLDSEGASVESFIWLLGKKAKVRAVESFSKMSGIVAGDTIVLADGKHVPEVIHRTEQPLRGFGPILGAAMKKGVPFKIKVRLFY